MKRRGRHKSCLPRVAEEVRSWFYFSLITSRRNALTLNANVLPNCPRVSPRVSSFALDYSSFRRTFGWQKQRAPWLPRAQRSFLFSNCTLPCAFTDFRIPRISQPRSCHWSGLVCPRDAVERRRGTSGFYKNNTPRGVAECHGGGLLSSHFGLSSKHGAA